MPRRRELPYDPTENAPEGRGLAPTAANTELAALMQCAPHEQPQWSAERLLPLRDVLADAIDNALTPKERWVFEATVIERRSIREVSADLNLAKSYIDRIKHRAVRKLRDALQDETAIKEYLTR